MNSLHSAQKVDLKLGKIVLLLVVLGGFILPAVLVPSVRADVSTAGITSFKVSGSANYTNPGGEAFWKSIPWTSAPLAASVSPGGGKTANVSVKSANNGFEVFVLFRWKVALAPSFESQNELYRAPNGSLLSLPAPGPGANITQLFYNSTYFYQDRVAALWFIANASSRQDSPKMELGTNGAITGGAADIWFWQANPSDNSKSDAGYPGGYTDPTGRAIFPPNNASFAENDYTNTTGFWVTGGSFGADAPNLDPYASPYVVLAASSYSSANKTWTVEMTRTFTTDDPNYRVQLTPGFSYYVAFGVWQGAVGESAEIKSVSQWYQLTISNSSPATVPVAAPSQGVTPLLAASVAIGTALVGFVIGSLAMSYRKEPHGSSA